MLVRFIFIFFIDAVGSNVSNLVSRALPISLPVPP